MSRDGKWLIHIDKGSIPRIEEIALMLYFSGNAIVYLTRGVFSSVGLSFLSPYGIYFINALTIIGIIVGILRLEKTAMAKCVFLFFAIALLIFINYLMNPEIGQWLRDGTYGLSRVFGLHGHIFGGGIVAFYIVIIQKNSDKIIRSLKVSNVILIIYLLMVLYNRLITGYFALDDGDTIRHSAYNMTFGYYCAFVSLLNLTLWLSDKKKMNLFLGIFFAVVSVAFGSRGTVITYALFIIISVWIWLKDARLTKRLIVIICIAATAFFIFRYYTQIIVGIQYALSSFGISNSRTISKLMSGDFFDGNGRDVLWLLGISMIKEKFPFGFGAFGERIVIGQYYQWGYIHNVFLELIIEFGVFGLIVLAFLLYKSFVIINDASSDKWKLLFVLFLSNCGMLIVSNSFWYCPYFWGSIAIGALYAKNCKK